MPEVTLTKTRCNKVQLEMPAETAKLLYHLVGGLNTDMLKGEQYIESPSITKNADQIREMCSHVFDPLYNNFSKDFL